MEIWLWSVVICIYVIEHDTRPSVWVPTKRCKQHWMRLASALTVFILILFRLSSVALFRLYRNLPLISQHNLPLISQHNLPLWHISLMLLIGRKPGTMVLVCLLNSVLSNTAMYVCFEKCSFNVIRYLIKDVVLLKDLYLSETVPWSSNNYINQNDDM